MLLDFGPQGSALLTGAAPVDETTPYVKWRGYGWTGETRGFTSAQFNKAKPDAMLSDFVWADLGSRTAVLRVDLPDGSYRARFWGGNYTSKAMPGARVRAGCERPHRGFAKGRPGDLLYEGRVLPRHG